LSVVEVIKEGRACISTNIATFIYFMVYCFAVTTMRTAVSVVAAYNYGEFMWFTMDVAINIGVVGTMTVSKVAPKLANYRPTATLLGPRTLVSVFAPYVCMLAIMSVGAALLNGEEFFQDANGWVHYVREMFVPGTKWMLRGDNFFSGQTLPFLFGTLVNVAYTNTYGGDFRDTILTNISVNFAYGLFMSLLIFLTLTPPNKVSCIWRVNCDTPSSLASGDFGWLAFWSAGNLGDCFMGPQVFTWQNQILDWLKPVNEKFFKGKESATQSYTWDDSIRWFPNKDISNCYPQQDTMSQWLKDLQIISYNKTSKDSTKIDIGGWAQEIVDALGPIELDAENSTAIGGNLCTGPNNCFPQGFKSINLVLLLVLSGLNHFLIKFVMQGPIAAKFRKHEVVEMTTMKQPLV